MKIFALLMLVGCFAALMCIAADEGRSTEELNKEYDYMHDNEEDQDE